MDRRRLWAGGRRVVLPAGERLVEAGAELRHMWIEESGAVSLRAPASAPHASDVEIELALVGPGGVVGSELALGPGRATLAAVVRLTTTAWRLGSGPFRQSMAANPALWRLTARQCRDVVLQAARTAASGRFDPAPRRLAVLLRQLVRCAGGARFDQTHGELAGALCVRRSTVSNAAHRLQRLGIIDYTRGE